MEFNNQQIGIIMQKVLFEASINQKNHSANYTDITILNVFNTMARIESIKEGEYLSFFQSINQDIFDSFKEIGAEDFVTLLFKSYNEYLAKYKDIKGLFKGGKQKEVAKECALNFMEDLNGIGGIDSISDNFVIPYAYENYKDRVDFGF